MEIFTRDKKYHLNRTSHRNHYLFDWFQQWGEDLLNQGLPKTVKITAPQGANFPVNDIYFLNDDTHTMFTPLCSLMGIDTPLAEEVQREIQNHPFLRQLIDKIQERLLIFLYVARKRMLAPMQDAYLLQAMKNIISCFQPYFSNIPPLTFSLVEDGRMLMCTTSLGNAVLAGNAFLGNVLYCHKRKIKIHIGPCMMEDLRSLSQQYIAWMASLRAILDPEMTCDVCFEWHPAQENIRWGDEIYLGWNSSLLIGPQAKPFDFLIKFI